MQHARQQIAERVYFQNSRRAEVRLDQHVEPGVKTAGKTFCHGTFAKF